MAEEVQVRYEITGATEGAAAITGLGTAARATDQALEESSATVEHFGQAATAAARGAAGTTEHTTAAGASAEQMAGRFAMAASSAQSLANRLGQGDAAGALGLAASLGHVVQAGLAASTMFGPAGGIAVGLAALVPVVADFVTSTEEVAVSTDAATEAQRNFALGLTGSLTAIDQTITSMRRLREAQGRTERIGQGLGTTDEQTAAAELAGARVGRLRSEDITLRREAASLDHTDYENAARLAEITQRRAELHGQIRDAQAESHRLGELAVQVAREEEEIQTDILTTATDATRAAEEQRRAATAHRSAEAGAREQARLEAEADRDDERAAAEQSTRTLQQRQQLREAEQAAIAKTTHLEEQAAAQAIRQQQQIEAATTQRMQKAQHQAQAAAAQRERDHQQALANAQAERAEREQMLSTLGSAANTITDMVLGAGDAYKNMTESQRQSAIIHATISAAIEAAEAVAAFASENYAGGVQHVVAAGLFVAAAAQAGGSASAPAVSAGPAARPTGPQSGTGNDRRPSPITVNVNAPSAIGGTSAQFGRGVVRDIRAAQQRFGGRRMAA